MEKRLKVVSVLAVMTTSFVVFGKTWNVLKSLNWDVSLSRAVLGADDGIKN